MADSLSPYRKKRNFAKTPEPRGAMNKRRGALRYVIQKHDASHLHFDFRLEADGVYKSWAVPKGPSLDPADKRLAMQVEDHPLEYGSFEGTIPQGQYGGGTVQLWDRGKFDPTDTDDAGRAIADGKLKFRLDGARLHGGWTLVRMHGARNKDGRAWLLIKEKDAFARPGGGDIGGIDQSVKSGRTLAEIAAKGRSKPMPADTAPALSNPDKLLWPDDGLTKRDLADYFAGVADLMLPFIAKRPLTLVRVPDGIEGRRFYQRHAGRGAAALIESFTAPRDAKPYLYIRSAAALGALAQMAAVEIHPWGATVDDIAHPDQLIFDLDPDGEVTFADLADAAFALRERLTTLGFETFAKFTGGKGIHVVAPLTPRATWTEAKAFARAVAIDVERAQPDRYTTNMRKAARSRRIFIDFLRNDLTATAIAPWSPRIRPGAPIAVPVTWAFLKKCKANPAFSMKHPKAALKHAADWRDFDAARRPLEAATIRKLAKV